VVVETAALNEEELGEHQGERTVFPKQIRAWGSACEQVDDWQEERVRRARAVEEQQRKRIRSLERELKYKENAVGDTAALLVLSKKAVEI
jgi:transposase